ncbi:protein-glutamine gamma-glutamyltransferase [Polaromonas sp.]|nr:protein-glutamine gamma-glutamyltransferase [Polaromonas sp.]
MLKSASPPLTALGKLPRDSRDTLFLLGVIAWILLPQVGRLPLWCSAGAAAILLWRGWLALRARALPNRLWLVLLLALTVVATYVTHNNLLGRDAGVTLLVLLLTLKTLELRARRDALVVFFLGFFCMLSNFFYSQSLLTAISMVLGLLGLLTALVNAHMPVGKPPLWQAAKIAGKMALLGAPIMLVLFLLFPRLAPLWGVPSDTLTGRSGLSESMEVGTMARLALEDGIAMRIKFDGPAPPQKALYFRGPVMSRFDGRTWMQVRTGPFERYPIPTNLKVKGEAIRYEVTLEPTRHPWLMLLDAAPQGPEMPGYQPVMSADLQWLTQRPITDLVRYKASSYPEFSHGPLRQMPGLQEFADLPPNFNPRTLALANEIRNDPRYAQGGDGALVEAALQHLRSGGYTYTLEPGVYGEHTADEFWFDKKEGFCEHIASAFVVLMRAMDIPARIVTGYQGGEQNSVDNLWTIRQSDAHAWTEVWLLGQGWVRIDPTSAVSPERTGAFQRLVMPPGMVMQALGTLSPTLSNQFRAVWDAINHNWKQYVLDYTKGQQFNLLKNIGFDSPSLRDLGYALAGVLAFSSLLGGAWTLWDRSQHDPWLRLFQQARKRLSKIGIASDACSTPRQLAQQVLARYPGEGQALHDWLMQLEQQRYAAPAAGSGRSARQALQALRQQLSQLFWPA